MGPNKNEGQPIPFEGMDFQPPENNLLELDADALNNYLEALFLARGTLKQQTGVNPDYLAGFDSILSATLMIAADRRDLKTVMAQAQMSGWVDNGADIIPIIEPRLRQFYESLKPENKEMLSSIPIIGVVGKIASGKGAVAEILSHKYDVMSFPFSDRLRAIALTMGYRPPYTRKQLRKINDVFKPAFGDQIFVEWTLTKAARMAASLHTPQMIVTDGFRSVTETEFFLKQPNTYLIAILASPDPEEDRQIRFQRQQRRHRGSEDTLTMEEFMEDDSIESTWIDPVIELAKKRGRVIINNGDFDNLSIQTISAISDWTSKD
jgi:dephospho-CoA kinase